VASASVDVLADVRGARRQGVALGVATGAYGISYGALAVAAGLSVPQTMVLSLVMFTGGSQFAFVGVVSAGGALAGAVTTAALLGFRNLLYGLRLSQLMPLRGPRRAAAALLTIDESSANAAVRETPEGVRAGFWSAGVSVYVLWALGSLIGALAGGRISDPATFGLDAAAAAAFLGLLWPRLADRRAVLVAAGAAGVAMLTVPVLPAGLPVLAAGAVAVVAGWREPGPRDTAAHRPAGRPARIGEEAGS
jgi:predicted branched-subunit amino acid permease